MPTYSYKCRRCGTEFEKLQKMSDPPRARCPACKGAGERLISGGAGLLFKGGGFYITDYRSESYKKAAKADGGEAAAGPEAKPDQPPKTAKAEKTGGAEKKPAPPAKSAGDEGRSAKRGRRSD